MMQTFYLGLDLCRDYTQISYYNLELKEPESMSPDQEGMTYLIPNVAFLDEEHNVWYVGMEANEKRAQLEGVYVDQVLEALETDACLEIGDITYSYEDILLRILKGHLDGFFARYTEMKLNRLVVTVEEYQPKVFEVLHKLQKEYGLDKKDFFIIGHSSAFLHYIIHQQESLRNNSVALFDYGRNGLDYYRMDIHRRKNPQIVTLSHKVFHDEIKFYRMYASLGELDEKFGELAGEILQQAYFSSVFLTGIGFQEPWIKKSQEILCSGRRVFLGQNIYAKGACYAAYTGNHVINPDKYIVNAEDMVHSDVGILCGEQGSTFYPIARGGREWYNMGGRIDVFLDGTNRVELLYKNHYTQDAQREIIEIHGLPSRPPKTTKLSLEVTMYSGSRGAIVIRDEGFGKLYPTTNKIYRKEFVLEQETEHE